MKEKIKCNGELVTINEHKIHVYRAGNADAPVIVFMSGHCTVSPVYDFKVLYEKLLHDFRVIVIEKFGYGYSDIYESSCDIDTLVSIQRQALEALGEAGPYILAPHSMSGLEAIRWKQKYPDDVSAIVGIDNRATMDLDTTLKNLPLTPEAIEKALKAKQAGGGAVPEGEPESGEYTQEQFIRDVQGVTGSVVDGDAGPETIGNELLEYITIGFTGCCESCLYTGNAQRIEHMGYRHLVIHRE